MANITEAKARENLRTNTVEKVIEMISAQGEEVLRTKSNEFCYPCVDELGNEQFIRITIAVPTGTKDEPYDGYAMRDDYELKLAQSKEKKAKKAKEKEVKIARDKARREKTKEIHNKTNHTEEDVPW